MTSLRGFAALLALGCLAACQQSKSHATPTKAPLVNLLDRGALKTVAETRLIEFGSGERDNLVEGWSKDERVPGSDMTFVWATALETVISFEVLDVTDLQFLVTLAAFPTTEPQRVTVLVNGHEVSSFTAQPIYLEYRFVAPVSILQHGENRLTFRHTELGSTAGAESSRRFAAAYSTLLIGPQCLPLRANGPPLQPIVHRKRPRNRPASLLVIGPAALRRQLEVPADAVLRYRLSLPPRSPAAALSTVRVHDAGTTTEIVARLPRPWFGGASSRMVEVDLAPWSGKTVDLEIQVGPDVCRTAVATAVIDQAAIAAKESATSG